MTPLKTFSLLPMLPLHVYGQTPLLKIFVFVVVTNFKLLYDFLIRILHLNH